MAGCGPDQGAYPYLRPDAGYPDGAPAEPAQPQDNVIEDDPLEDWDTTGAGPLTGIFAVELVIPAKVVSIAIESRELFRFRLLQHGRELRLRSQMCRLALPSVEAAELRVPLVLEMLIRSKGQEVQGEYLSADEPVGASFAPPEVLVVLGATLAKPGTDPLPTPEDPATARDEDRDGKPGVTLLASTAICVQTEKLYVAVRATGALSGTVESLDAVAGQAQSALDQSVLGYSHECLSIAAGLSIEILPGATFRAVRVGSQLDVNHNGNVTCGEIVLAAPALFGSFWSPGG
ncbi:MAG: hypothetical protein HY744_00755 [Deltaproteobacteria bacterium]|nr:hypothetical protein [Deltaproteobacteria bacterium]